MISLVNNFAKIDYIYCENDNPSEEAVCSSRELNKYTLIANQVEDVYSAIHGTLLDLNSYALYVSTLMHIIYYLYMPKSMS